MQVGSPPNVSISKVRRLGAFSYCLLKNISNSLAVFVVQQRPYSVIGSVDNEYSFIRLKSNETNERAIQSTSSMNGLKVGITLICFNNFSVKSARKGRI